jgi:hypothetical protein
LQRQINNIHSSSTKKLAHTGYANNSDGMVSMTTNLVVYVKDGHIVSVLSDYPDGMKCLVIRSGNEAIPHIKGEPWVRSMDFPDAKNQQAVLEPMTVEFDTQKVRKIMSLEDSSRQELAKLLG